MLNRITALGLFLSTGSIFLTKSVVYGLSIKNTAEDVPEENHNAIQPVDPVMVLGIIPLHEEQPPLDERVNECNIKIPIDVRQIVRQNVDVAEINRQIVSQNLPFRYVNDQLDATRFFIALKTLFKKLPK